MTVLPMVLIVVGVLLLLALAAGLWWQRRRSAVPAGPRTVADLVSKRAAEGAFAAGPPAFASAPTPGAEIDEIDEISRIEPADLEPADLEPADLEPAEIEPADPEPADPEPAEIEPTDVAPAGEGPTVAEPAESAAVADEGAAGGAPDEVAPPDPDVAEPAAADAPENPAPGPLGGEAPWRRATHMSTAAEEREPVADPEQAAESGRIPALALLRGPITAGPRDPALDPPFADGDPPRGRVADPPASPPSRPDPDPAVEDRPHWSTPGRGVAGTETDFGSPGAVVAVLPFPVADPDIMFDTPPAPVRAVHGAGPVAEPVVAEPVVAEPVGTEPDDAEPDDAEPAGAEQASAQPLAAEPGEAESWSDPARPRRDPARLAAEQAAADLALLRTFGSADLGSRPDRAPVVALEGCRRPGPGPGPGAGAGAAQPVRFRTVRRDGAAIPDVAVALLDDRGYETSTGRSGVGGSGELRAPHPGSYVLVATAPDHLPGAVALTVAEVPVDADVLLVRSASLVGTVTGEDGPIAGARVTLVQDGEVVDSTESGADGGYTVADMAAGEYALSVAAAGCEPHVTLVVVPEEAELVHDVDLAPAGVGAG
ncbi:carboxypeptidase regulatory-like domain-containing protein [Pseudonocardia sp.]|uniref:carboxypeptidase regulatory-like domain-containing protein n=1 Tax=Pseudonocardia sp. TaxID=60912 RepID=UPI0026372FA9|nr:carboxypeptidase regulatory-like domain-containing protein [Pseudonocardia sp.]